MPAPRGRRADERVSFYRLVERLGRGGFAEVWRARPEPAGALAAAPAHEVQRAVAALASLLEGREGPSPIVTRNLAESLAALERMGPARPAAVFEEHLAAAQRVFVWAEELAASGGLDVALKVPFHDGYVRQMRREKDILHRVAHPRLARQFQLDVEHDPPFMAMELVPGWSLRDALKEEPRPHMAKLLSIMDQLLTALDYLHRRGLVHGDVKPENIMVEPGGAVRLIDLGLGSVSQAVMRDTYLSLSLASRVPLLGTLSYMAPEVRKGAPAGPAADLFSAGIVLYEMLVGDVPHGMALPTEAAADRSLSTRFDVLLKWVLHPDPTKRVPSARELRERVLLTLKERPKHQLGKGRGGVAREGTLDFDQWALDNASPFVAGDWVGPYQLEEPLGRGGFGEVWRARRGGEGGGAGEADEEQEPERREATDGACALKLAVGPGGKEGLRREAEVAARLDHPRIPAVHEVQLEHEPPYLAVDYVRGRSLRARLTEEGPLDVATAMLALGSLAHTLAHCHARGVVHQDLKPENLLLDEREGALFLLDFGLASTPADAAPRAAVEVSKHLASGDVDAGGGTFEYMPPERRRGERGGPPADAYALGVILFESLTGELPRGLTRLRELCPLAPLGLEALCTRLLDPLPGKRPGLGEVALKLGQDVPRRQAGPTRRLVRGAEARRYDRALGAVGLVLTFALLVVGGNALLHRPRHAAPAPDDGPDRRSRVLLRAERAGAEPPGILESIAEELRRLGSDEDRRLGLALMRVSTVAAHRARADDLAERGRWAFAQARLANERWRRSGGGPREASDGVSSAAHAVERLEAALSADPWGPGAPEVRVDLSAARALLAAWRAEVAERGAAQLRELAARPALAASFALELELVVPGAADAAAVDSSRWGPWRAELDRRLLREAFDRHDLHAARDAIARLEAADRDLVLPADRAGLAQLAANLAMARALEVGAELPGSTLPRLALIQRLDRLGLREPWLQRALTRGRAANRGRALGPDERVAQARLLLWESHGLPDEALGVLDVAGDEADPDLVAVVRVLAGEPCPARPLGPAVRALLAEHAQLSLVARRARERAEAEPGGDDPAPWREVARCEQDVDRLAWRLRLAVTPR